GGVNNTGVQYGWFNYFLDKNSKIEFGHLITKIGYESLYSYQNPHILHSTMWRAQPTTYGGIRYSSEAGDISFYGEFTNGGGLRQAGAFGASGRAGNLDYVAQIYDEKDGIQIIEATITMKSGNLPISVNVNSISHDISLPGVDSKATGLALYTKTDISGLDTPIRVEYVKDGTSGIYAYTNLPIDKAWSITVTPTKNFDKKTYLRGEFSFINAENEVFTDTNGSSQKTNMFLGLQAGMKF
ncbi:MAG: porin, partial [Gammaproteobacteria bacterium]|nr:porin [Gammaproteobacteria bacterium]